MKDLQKRKKLLVKLRQAVYVVIIAYVAVVLLYNFVFVSGESFTWVLTGESRTVYYNVSQSGDDAFLHLGHTSFSATAKAQPFQMTGYDIEGGLVYSIPDRVYNATHREVPSNAWLEFWSDDQTMLPSGSISFYQINDSTIGPFTSYADLNDAVYPWFLGNMPLSEFGRGPNPLGWEGWRDGSLWFLTNAVNKVGSPYFPGLDNNSLGLKYIASSGNLEYFNTYDDNSSRAPRIGVVWEMQEWINATVPGGYTDDDYREKYRGFHIWEDSGFGGWLNYSTFTQIGSNPKETGIIDTEFTVFQMYSNSQSWFRRDYDTYRDPDASTIRVIFGVNFTAQHYSVNQDYVTLWGVSSEQDASSDWTSGYSLEMRADAGGEIRFYAWAHAGGVIMDSIIYATLIPNADLPYARFFDVVIDFATRGFDIIVYDDIGLTIINSTRTEPFTTGPVWSPGLWDYEFANARYDPASPDCGYSGVHLSDELVSVFIATDDNGTLLCDLYPDSIDPEYDDIEDLKDAIDRLLGGVGGDYDILPDLGNTLILLMGIMGMIMIPGSFIMLGHSIREGDWVTGFYYLLMFFFLGLGFVTVWLFG